MLEMGGIEESTSDWCCPIELVCKSDGSIRFCVDYHRINKVSKFVAYPMPQVYIEARKLAREPRCQKHSRLIALLLVYWQLASSSVPPPVALERTRFASFVRVRVRLRKRGWVCLWTDTDTCPESWQAYWFFRRIQGDTLYMCEQFGVNGTLYFYVMRTSCFMAKPRNGPHHHTHQVRLRGLVSSLVSIVCVASLNNK